MTKKEKELIEKGYHYFKKCETRQQAKKCTAALRQNGFYATFYMETRNGVPYYLIYSKNICSRFAVWGGNIKRENAYIIIARSCDHALELARVKYDENLTSVKRLYF